jgi:hypothetical protein
MSQLERIHNLVLGKMPFVDHYNIECYDYYHNLYQLLYHNIIVKHCFNDTYELYHTDEHGNIIDHYNYRTIDAAVNRVVNFMMEDLSYYKKYADNKLEKREEKNRLLKQKIKDATQTQKEIVDLLIANFAHTSLEKSENDDLLTLQRQCKSIIEAIIKYHPESEEVDNLEKEFKNLSTRIREPTSHS